MVDDNEGPLLTGVIVWLEIQGVADECVRGDDVGLARGGEPGPGGWDGKDEEELAELVGGVVVTRVQSVRNGDMVCQAGSLKIPGTKSLATVLALSSVCWTMLW